MKPPVNCSNFRMQYSSPIVVWMKPSDAIFQNILHPATRLQFWFTPMPHEMGQPPSRYFKFLRDSDQPSSMWELFFLHFGGSVSLINMRLTIPFPFISQPLQPRHVLSQGSPHSKKCLAWAGWPGKKVRRSQPGRIMRNQYDRIEIWKKILWTKRFGFPMVVFVVRSGQVMIVYHYIVGKRLVARLFFFLARPKKAQQWRTKVGPPEFRTQVRPALQYEVFSSNT